MQTVRRCTECGADLGSDEPSGLCPKCLLGLGLAAPLCDPATAEAFPLSCPRQFGDYLLLAEIARGGMGVVYRARQVSLDRLVAVKTLLAGPLASREYIHRFRTEASTAANLQHPNIVGIHEVGTHEGENYLVMDLVEGPSLARVIGLKPLPARRAAGYVRTVAEAIHYAHQLGILHRDLKPSNVLIDANDQPRVTDFGLAKRLDGEGELTLSGQVLGSPNFMSPEQAAGSRGEVSRRTDVYGLGAILYHALTARPPFQAETLMGTLQQVIQADPISPRLLIASIPHDLETITMKCLEKEQALRYHTAKELADELGRFLDGEPIVARPLGIASKAWRWCRRKPALATALAAACLAAASAGIFAVQAHKAERQRLEEQRQYVIERAMLAARTGDLEETEKFIRDAELASASLGQVRSLRGQMAFHRSEYAEAVQQLEQAVKLAPQSMATHAMLSMAYIQIGRWDKAQRVVRAMQKLTPKAPEDYLFRGQFEAYWDPEHGLALLNESVGRHPTALARWIRAEVRLAHANLTGSLPEAEEAASDVAFVIEAVPRNPSLIALSLFSHIILANAYADAGQSEKHDAALRQADSEAESLVEFPKNRIALRARATYFRRIGDDDQAMAELSRGAHELSDVLLDCEYARALYERGRFQEALEALGNGVPGGGSAPDFIRGYILAELPDGLERALQEFRVQWEVVSSRYDAVVIQTILRLLGRRPEAVEVCRRADLRPSSLPPWRGGWVQRLLDFNADKLSEADLLRAAGSSRWSLCEAQFYIGINELAKGNRSGAREHFRQAVDTRVYGFFEYNWSRAFLFRMESDPAWPHWIPTR